MKRTALFLFLFFAFFSTTMAQQGNSDPETGRCFWTDPNGVKLVCPSVYPSCSDYTGVCYRWEGAVLACKFSYMAYTWFAVSEICDNYTNVPVVAPTPVPTNPPVLPFAPVAEENLTCPGGFTYNKYVNNNGVPGSLLENKNIMNVALSEQTPNIYHVVSCTSFTSTVFGDYKFRFNSKDSLKVVLDDTTIYENASERELLATPEEKTISISKGSHKFEVIGFNKNAPAAIFVD